MSSDLILVPLHNAVRSKMLDVQKTMTACDTVRGAGKITHALLVDGWTARSRASTPARAFPPATFPRGDGLVGCGGGRASLNCAAPGLQSARDQPVERSGRTLARGGRQGSFGFLSVEKSKFGAN